MRATTATGLLDKYASRVLTPVTMTHLVKAVTKPSLMHVNSSLKEEVMTIPCCSTVRVAVLCWLLRNLYREYHATLLPQRASMSFKPFALLNTAQLCIRLAHQAKRLEQLPPLKPFDSLGRVHRVSR